MPEDWEILGGKDNSAAPDVLVSANDLTKVIDLTGYGAKNFAMQVKGVGATPTHWNVGLLGSLDGVTYSPVILTHTDAASANADGDVAYVANKPANFIKAKLVSVTLGSATGIKVLIKATQ